MSYRRIAIALLVSVFILIPSILPAQTLKTPAEQSGYSRYTQYQEVSQFLSALDEASRQVTVQTIGKTLDAKDFPAANLFLTVITEEGAASPAALNRKKLTLLIVASQHGNEQSAKEAALQLIRDAAIGDLQSLLKRINLLVIPQANPYGNFFNRRQNEQNLDLNRDHVKLESPETRAIHAVFNQWMPEVTLDIHEKGDDYYRVSTGCVSNVNISEGLQRFSREIMFPEIARSVAAAGYTWHEYLVSDTIGSGMAAGARGRGAAGQPREVLMRYSTPDLNDGRNSLGIYESLSFIQEGASRHDVETLMARTGWQYSGIRALVEKSAAEDRRIRDMVRGLRKSLLKVAAKPPVGSVVHLRMEYVRDPKEPELPLKRFERPQPAGAARQTELKVVQEIVKNWLPKVESKLAVPRPIGYVVPAAQEDVIKTLLDHGIRLQRLIRDTNLEVQTYQIGEIVPSKEDYVAPEKIDVTVGVSKAKLRKGDFYVSAAQPAANLIPCLLEPQSEYGLIRYRAFRLVTEIGATFPILRVTRIQKLPLETHR